MGDFLSGTTAAATEFSESWELLRDIVQGSGVSGPLDSEVASAGRGVGQHLQRAITEQVERVQRDQLHRDIMQLPRTDTRRIAWMAVDRLSSQWVPSWPTHRLELSDVEMPEVITTYLGRESPVVRALAGRTIPCGFTCRRGGPGPRVCDAHGFQIGLATLPGDDDTECHDAISRELFDTTHAAGLHTELQPWHIFTSLVPVADLIAASHRRGRPPGIIPDAAVDVALPAVVTARGQRRGPSRLLRRLLFDVKTIHAGTDHYYSAHARDEQSGAVRHREAQVWPSYLRHARDLDRRYSPAGMTPIEDRLRSYTETRGAVFGAYGEASDDVHGLIAAAATASAERQYRLTGARTAAEMRSFIVGQMRRRIGLTTVQAMARHRLSRVPYIGVPREAIISRQQRLQQAAMPRGGGVGDFDPRGFYVYQAGHVFHHAARG